MIADEVGLSNRVLSCLNSAQIHLAESLSLLDKAAPDLSIGDVVRELNLLLSQHPVGLSPWIYLGYYELGKVVLQAGGNPHPPGGPPQPSPDQQVVEFHAANALALIQHGLTASRFNTEARNPQVIGFGDPAEASAQMWATLLAMLQEGGDFVVDICSPSSETIGQFEAAIRDARRLISLVNPALDTLMSRLQRLLLLAEPGPQARTAGQNFGGATAFFFRGGSVINASRQLHPTAMLELLVHEYAHGELFALGQEQVLCLNQDDERYPVLIRSDPRPMHGILHSLHVVSRVVGVIDKILQLSPAALPDGGASQPAFRDLLVRQHAYGRSSLAAIREHARLTPLGQEVVEAAVWRLGLQQAEPSYLQTAESL
ncbi:hypothetical protein KBY96_06295 [Cyanobium sp. ATX 6A2]|uniref:aKG-HExxH-type peptide beta-hydroxylase n=1 Tax=Cyanobium sp. ATX 6A2 TaxID=2823700 RepID=UPI0020CE8F03|nr:HEXXH motif-containing putative peptide modification protein [Cyanobium sp. ATX 6A2]MCP9887544.1 hypothetical protein [Cyanobium sp. ATX 6A2]